MATVQVLVLLLAVTLTQVQAFPTEMEFQPVRLQTNTIFGDEKLQGAIFEGIDDEIFSKETVVENVATRNDENLYRLPTTTKPMRYTILWSMDFPNFAVGGNVKVQLAATQEGVNQIVMHANDINILSVVLSKSGISVPVNYTIDDTYQFFIITLTSDTLEYNSFTDVIYELNINFDFLMRTDMYGIYRSWYKTNNETKWMASTHFQATHARQAFPCYDEPGFKAYFEITIRRPTTYKSWSNMRIAETTNSTVAGFQDDRFYSTPLMSTYLIAAHISEYESLALYDNTTGLLKYEVIGRPDVIQSGQGEYAFEVGQELLDEMSNHTNFDYLSINQNMKMTQASVPDFSAGAMENWGLLNYRESYLMYAEGQTNGNFKQIIAYILSHEIAHMWFGNLVTCDWWDVFWLNEGFARYYQYFLTHWVEDYMDFETRFITEQVHTALLSDSANNPHSLSNPEVIGTPVEIRSMFSTLSYNKGAAVIRMTEHLLGFEVNREGLRNYLSQNAFNTALPIKLFESLQAAAEAAGAIEEYGSDFSLIDYYKSFTDQQGHPILNVYVNHQTGDMMIQQRRFNVNTGYSNVETNWIVPISFATASNPNFNNTKPTHIIKDSVSIINRGSVGDEWVIFNIQQTGFYRVNYDDYTWDLIALALRNNTIHEYNRAQIVDDVFLYARSGLMTYTRAFSILSFLENETVYAPWAAAVTGFSWIRNRLVGTPEHEQLNNMIANWASTVMNDLTYYPGANDNFMRLYLRYQLAPTMCAIGVTACRAAATTQFQALKNNSVEVHPDSRVWVYCNALRDGTEDDFDFLWTRYQNHEVKSEKVVILQSIGCTPHANSLNTILDGIFQVNELIRPQDYATALNIATSGNEVNTQIVFQYMQENVEAVMTSFNYGFVSPATPFSYVSARLRTEEEVNAFQAWATSAQAVLGSIYTTVYNGAESSRTSIQWAAELQPDFNNYFTFGGDNIVTSTAAFEVTTPTTTESAPVLSQPDTPAIPDSASTAVVSAFVILFAAVTNMMY